MDDQAWGSKQLEVIQNWSRDVRPPATGRFGQSNFQNALDKSRRLHFIIRYAPRSLRDDYSTALVIEQITNVHLLFTISCRLDRSAKAGGQSGRDEAGGLSLERERHFCGRQSLGTPQSRLSIPPHKRIMI